MSSQAEEIGKAIASEIITDNYANGTESGKNWQAEVLDVALLNGLDGDGIRAMLVAAATRGYTEGTKNSLSRVKTAFHRLAGRVAIDDENTVRVPLDEILMYTPENRANIARMLRREADSL